jgi:capsular polysaccharide export protein
VHNGYLYYLYNLKEIFTKRRFRGWGRKRTGRFAAWCHHVFGGSLILEEDGFIRSVGLGVEGARSFSRIEDDTGIYYDAHTPSALERLYNEYDFENDRELMETADRAIGLIRRYGISKYNPPLSTAKSKQYLERIFGGDGKSSERILIVTQTAKDASLIYGRADAFSTEEMIEDAKRENPAAEIYIKIHPDVLRGKKEADCDVEEYRKKYTLIEEPVDPMLLLSRIDKVYTKTSGMGMEALIMQKEVHCYGMPFYAGWGLTSDVLSCERRKRRLGLKELFAGAYICYTRYNDPHDLGKETDILTVIEYIAAQKERRSDV